MVTVLAGLGIGMRAALADVGLPFAAPAAAAASTSSGANGIGHVTLALAVVLLAIFGFAWLARRLRGIGRGVRGNIEVLGDLALGPKERAVLLRVGGAVLLVGVAPGQVRTLHSLGEAESGALLATASAKATDAVLPRSDFRAVLLRSLGR
jgi:flagellar protein FliO/FliZ